MAPRGKFNKSRGRGGRGGRGGKAGGGAHRPHQDNRQSFREIDKTNEKFERYYDSINIVPAGPEREAFWASLRRELPNSFRFTGSRGHALSVRKNLVERFFPLISEIKHEGRPVEIPKQIPWYPDGLAYTMTTPKNVVRKYEPFKEFQKFLVSETGVGNISRQEHVSMIPPLLLDVRPEHTVLDLCAAPGSKSAQLIEAVHAGEEDRVSRAIELAKDQEGSNGVELHETNIQDDGRTTGLLVANDVNYSRAQMLVHQVKRLNSPNLVVTNHDATMFPSIELPSPSSAPGQPKRGRYLKFDRILADVPCSGDGTCRKNPAIWKDWNPQNGLGLYITQVRILTRALQMLKLGGRVVYSTCSMNPVEDEAVVASAIERCGGVAKVRLLDCSDTLPTLVRNEGLTDWSIMSRNGQIYESYPEAEQYEPEGSKVVPGMFPPDSEEHIPLQHCMRVYPHQQDTGGFFIAVMEKLSEIRAKPESESKSMKKDWKFGAQQPDPVSAPNTLVGELLEELEHPPPPTHSDGDLSSSAARQNSDTAPETLAGSKRKASDDEDMNDDEVATKRSKVGDILGEFPNSESGARREHWPLPPAVELAIEAADAGAGSTVVEDSAETTQTASQLTEVQPRRRRRDNEAPHEEAFKYLHPDHSELESIYNFYELHDNFPRDRFLVRNPAGDPVKGIYYTSQLVKDILTTNEGRGMKFVHAGVKMFMKQDSQGQDICRWRIQLEGLPIIEGWVGDGRVVTLRQRGTLRKLLVEMFPKIGSKETPEGAGGWRELGEIGEQVLNMGMGCCVLRVVASEEEDGFEEGLTLPLWRSLHSLNLMLPKEDRRAMLLRIFNEDTELINHSDPKGARAPNGSHRQEQVKGSIAAEEDGRELQRRIESPVEDKANTALSDTDGILMEPEIVTELDALAEEDRERAEEMEVLEDDETKVQNAMPERAGEGDEMNTTV